MLIDMSENVSPTLIGGSFDVYFGQFEKVKAAMVYVDNSMNLDSSAQLCVSCNYNPIDSGSYNYVRVYLTYINPQTNTAAAGRITATTAMLNGKKVVVLATGGK